MPMQGGFDANQFAPQQLGDIHPVGKFPFTISSTKIEQNKAGDGGYLTVAFTSPVGTTLNRYNLWNPNPKAVEIAHGQLSALCHATGIFKLDWQNDGAALIGGRGQMEIVDQLDENRKPNGYTRIAKVFDANGNEPGKGSAQQHVQQGQQQAPLQQQAPNQPSQNWQPGPSQPQLPNQQAGWSTQGNQQSNQQQQWGGGNQQPTQGNPPWANR